MSTEQNASNTGMVAEPFYVTTAQAVRMLGCDNQKLWRLMKAGKLSPPRRLSPRRCVWLQDELEALGGKLQPVLDGYFMPRARAARLLRVCRETVSRMVAAGTLPAKRKNGRLFFRPEDVKAAQDQRRNNERLDWRQTAALLGLRLGHLVDLWSCNCFIACELTSALSPRRHSCVV